MFWADNLTTCLNILRFNIFGSFGPLRGDCGSVTFLLVLGLVRTTAPFFDFARQTSFGCKVLKRCEPIMCREPTQPLKSIKLENSQKHKDLAARKSGFFGIFRLCSWTNGQMQPVQNDLPSQPSYTLQRHFAISHARRALGAKS